MDLRKAYTCTDITDIHRPVNDAASESPNKSREIVDNVYKVHFAASNTEHSGESWSHRMRIKTGVGTDGTVDSQK